ncbi:hypothetical protein RhiirC2_861911 [Rhizophagus irregularis]|uniref:Uncharacterized protein n=1 Tax=Rhizophagus irregularis TaxID=588596 RepID=A0A2N1NUA0_9GLOM|nr:hypothetical protein RhiirC2_861911 [Rhizophagus irregularis]
MAKKRVEIRWFSGSLIGIPTSEHLTRKVRGNDLSSRYCTLSSERRFVFSQFNGTSSFFESDYNHSLHSPPPFSIVFTSGAIVGAAQFLVAAPLDSLKVRFEVNDLLEGKHKSMFVFAKTTWKALGVAKFCSRILDMFLDFRFGKLQ